MAVAPAARYRPDRGWRVEVESADLAQRSPRPSSTSASRNLAMISSALCRFCFPMGGNRRHPVSFVLVLFRKPEAVFDVVEEPQSFNRNLCLIPSPFCNHAPLHPLVIRGSRSSVATQDLAQVGRPTSCRSFLIRESHAAPAPAGPYAQFGKKLYG